MEIHDALARLENALQSHSSVDKDWLRFELQDVLRAFEIDRSNIIGAVEQRMERAGT